MKSRVVSLLLILALVASCSTGIIIFYKEFLYTDTTIAIISDVHVKANSVYNSQDTFDYYASRDKQIHLSEPILKSIIDEILASKKVKTVFVTGDLTEDGDKVSHQAVADSLKKLTDNGLQVFIINGNHDDPKGPEQLSNKPTAQQFRDIYWNFGYSNAIATDDKSLSYVAEIDNKNRVIAIDNDDYYSTDINDYKQEMDQRLIGWIEDQIKKCQSDKKTPLVILHKPLVNHLDFIGKILGKGIDSSFDSLADMLADNGCQYVFSGHLHGQDIAYYASAKGNRLLDIETSSSVYVPGAYRFVSFTNSKVKISSRQLDKLNVDYVSEYLKGDDYALVKDNFTQYAYDHFRVNIRNQITSIITAQRLQDMLGLSDTNAELIDLISQEVLNPLLSMPIYDNGQSISIEKIVSDNGGQPLPETDYQNLFDLAAFFVYSLNFGDQNISFDSNELIILKNGIMTIFYLLDTIKDDISDLLPELPFVTIDVPRLFSQGELELVDSNILKFVALLLKDMTGPFNLGNIGFYRTVLFEGILDGFKEGLGEKVVSTIGENEILLDKFIEEVIYKFLIVDILQDNYPGDNNVIFDRKTLEPVV